MKAHKEILNGLKREAGTANRDQATESYTGSTHIFYAVPVPARRAVLMAWLREHKSAGPEGVLQLADRLFCGRSHEEKTMGAMLLGYRRGVRQAVTFSMLDRWLSELVGWAEVDALCQGVFSAEELLADWDGWKRFLTKLSKDRNINKRRASLVFLTMPTAKSDDARLHALGYELIERLKGEKDIRITKAVSWLLRSMADTKKNEVAEYVKKNADSLPKVAVRETQRKIRTGKKN